MYCVREAGAGYRQCGGGPGNRSAEAGRDPVKLNPYDLYAMESALGMKEQQGGTVDVITMGPGQAREALKECMCMGADRAGLISDRKFAGADVVATSYTLSQGIRRMGSMISFSAANRPRTGTRPRLGRRWPSGWEYPMPPMFWKSGRQGRDGYGCV